MQIDCLIEHDVTPVLRTQIATLRDQCFPDFHSERSYYKQLPHFRFIARDGETLAGHLGVDHRVIKVGERVVSIFGAIDLCVAPEFRRRGLASRLLQDLENLGRIKAVHFLLLAADDARLYERHGFTRVSAHCTWLRIDEHTSLGIGRELIVDTFMIKPLGDQPWPDGDIDLLGYLF